MSAPVCPRRAGEPAPLSAREEQLYGVQTSVLHRDAEHAVYRLRSSDGEVIKTCYPVFPGITITYNDVHASYCQMGRAAETGLVEINHCREGRVEYQLGEDYFYLAPGDLSVTLKDASPGEDRFPTGHYHGITVDIDPARAPDCLSCFLEDVTVRPGLLAEKFCCNGGGFAARSSPHAEHVFSELYSVPEEIRKGYFKVKILELLLFLSTLPAPAAGTVRLARPDAHADGAGAQNQRIPSRTHGAEGHGLGARGKVRCLRRAGQKQLSGRVRHDSRGLPPGAENARSGRNSSKYRPNGT